MLEFFGVYLLFIYCLMMVVMVCGLFCVMWCMVLSFFLKLLFLSCGSVFGSFLELVLVVFGFFSFGLVEVVVLVMIGVFGFLFLWLMKVGVVVLFFLFIEWIVGWIIVNIRIRKLIVSVRYLVVWMVYWIIFGCFYSGRLFLVIGSVFENWLLIMFMELLCLVLKFMVFLISVLRLVILVFDNGF